MPALRPALHGGYMATARPGAFPSFRPCLEARSTLRRPLADLVVSSSARRERSETTRPALIKARAARLSISVV
jgi:hypothetical protein